MLPLTLPSQSPLRLLCIGAHADDIEIGCGGTILTLLAERRRVAVHWVVLCSDAVREKEARRSAARILKRAASHDIQIMQFRDAFLPYDGALVKEYFQQLAKDVFPDVIFTHHARDAHQDHRFASELTSNAFRDHTILEYEIPKYDGDLGQPTVFVPLSAPTRRRKVRHLMTAFPSQRNKRWFTPDTFEAVMRLRGIECGAAEGHAEAFHCRKLLLRA